MGSPAALHIWIGRAAYFGCAALLIFASLVPMRFNPGGVPAPDLLLALTFSTVLRRPDFAPFWLVFAIFLLADTLSGQPLALWTGIVLISTEFLRTQERRFRELIFPFEWAFFTAVFFLAILANRIILTVALVPVADFGAQMLYFFVTVITYPLVVLFCYAIIHIRKITPGEAVRLGHRL